MQVVVYVYTDTRLQQRLLRARVLVRVWKCKVGVTDTVTDVLWWEMQVD
jgi:hypothetical protein